MTTPGVSHPSATTVEDFRHILDERAVAGDPARLLATVVQAERTDAVVIAEGIETIKHAREAVAAGATVGQGSCSGTRRLVPGR